LIFQIHNLYRYAPAKSKSTKGLGKKKEGKLTVDDVEEPDTMEVPEFKKVGLYMLSNSVDPSRLKAPGFNP
jgi:hypothetical protein